MLEALIKMFHRCPVDESEAQTQAYIRGLKDARDIIDRHFFQDAQKMAIDHKIELLELSK